MRYWIWHCVVLCIEQVQVARLSCVIEEIDCKIGWRVVLGHVEHTHTECGVRTLLRFRDWSRFELDQGGAGRAVLWVARCACHLLQRFEPISRNIHPAAKVELG